MKGSMLFSIGSAFANVAYAASSCRAIPGDSTWPSISSFNSLNSSIGGQLIATKPLAASCHLKSTAQDKTKPYSSYDAQMCSYVNSNWGGPYIHEADPASVQYANNFNDSCLPSNFATNTTPCSLDGLPLYVVNATDVSHISKGVAFAKANNIRLVVKNTGHDFLGKSAGGNALSIWVHNMAKISYTPSFAPATPYSNCKINYTGPAITSGPGAIVADLYKFADSNGVVVVAGANPTVGISGHHLGGGHSPLSSMYGMSADQILSMQVVLADGSIVTANDCSNTDLFYALRGGGGGTFGVVSEFTVRAYKTPTIQRYIIVLNSTQHTQASVDTFFDAVAYLHSKFPNLNDNGVSGYTFQEPLDAPKSGVPLLTFQGAFIVPNGNLTAIKELWAPIESNIKARGSGISYAVVDTSSYPTWSTHFNTAPFGSPDAAGYNNLLSSRLVNRTVLENQSSNFRQQLVGMSKTSINGPYGLVLGHLVAGKQVAAKIGGENSVNPAWRSAYFHIVLSANPAETEDKVKYTSSYNAALADLETRSQSLRTLGSGCYLSEADRYEKNFQSVFYGSANYAKLLAIKQKYDPSNVFYCRTCVGSESYIEDNTYRLCHV